MLLSHGEPAAHVHVPVPVARVELDGAIELLAGGLVSAGLEQDVREREPRRRIVRGELGRRLKARFELTEPRHLQQSEERLRVRRVCGQRALVHRGCGVVGLRAPQRRPEIDEEDRLIGLGPDGLLQEQRGQGTVPGMEQDPGQEAQRADVTGILGQPLPAHGHGLPIAAGPDVIQREGGRVVAARNG